LLKFLAVTDPTATIFLTVIYGLIFSIGSIWIIFLGFIMAAWYIFKLVKRIFDYFKIICNIEKSE
jgi:hypothetical protein